MNDEFNLKNIMLKLQKKYMKLIELSNLTNELSQALKTNDHDSINMIIVMRANEMDEIDVIDYEISEILYNLDFKQRNLIMSKKLDKEIEVPNEILKIREIYDKIRRLLEKIISVDRNMNIRIAGNDSYYNKCK